MTSIASTWVHKMLACLWSLAGIVAAARQYELIAIHSDSVFAYTTIQLDPSTTQLTLTGGDAVSFEFENGGLLAHSKHGNGVITIQDGFAQVSQLSNPPPNYGWSLKDNIYLQGTYWICGDKKVIATGDVDAPKSCTNPVSVMLYAAPIRG